MYDNKISVIVPVYNIGQYLESSIKSLINTVILKSYLSTTVQLTTALQSATFMPKKITGLRSFIKKTKVSLRQEMQG